MVDKDLLGNLLLVADCRHADGIFLTSKQRSYWPTSLRGVCRLLPASKQDRWYVAGVHFASSGATKWDSPDRGHW